MKEPRHDDERLSELLAGRLDGPERDELLAYLSTADEDLEVFAHTAAILREMDEEDAREEEEKKPDSKAAPPPPGKATVPSMSKSTRPRRNPRWAVVRAVAGLVVLGALAWLAWPGRGAPDVSPLRLAMNADAGAGLPFDASRPSAGIPGDATRGEGDAARTPQSAARAGAFLVRLALAVQARDSAATGTLALQARQRFDPGGASALRRIEARAGAPPAELQPLLEEATERLEGRLGADYLRLGAWTEAARWAARRRDAGYFRSPESVDMLAFAEDLTEDDQPAREAVAAVRSELSAEQPDWISLERTLTALLDAIAS